MKTIFIYGRRRMRRTTPVACRAVALVVVMQLGLALPLHRHPALIHDCASSCAHDEDCAVCAAMVPATPVASIGAPIPAPIRGDAPVVQAGPYRSADPIPCEARAPPVR